MAMAENAAGDMAEIPSALQALSEVDRRKYLVALELLDLSEEPVGARRLSDELRRQGMDAAEATAGRLLRSFDDLGWSSNSGKRGRRITRAGRTALSELRLQDQFAAQTTHIAEAANAADLSELADLMHLRRAVEAENARLAAVRATDAELDLIDRAAQAHVGCIHTETRVDQSLNFHMLVAKASHNPLLEAVSALVLGVHNHKLADLMDVYLAGAGPEGQVVHRAHEHLDLVEALRRRDPDAAESIMRAHIDRMIESIPADRRG